MSATSFGAPSGLAIQPGLEHRYEYNGLLINDLRYADCYCLTRITGFEDPELRTSSESRPGDHGGVPLESLYGERTIILEGYIRCGSIGKLRDMQMALKNAFGGVLMNSELPLIVRDTITGDAGGDRTTYINCRKSGPIGGVEEQTSWNPHRTFQIVLKASYPFLRKGTGGTPEADVDYTGLITIPDATLGYFEGFDEQGANLAAPWSFHSDMTQSQTMSAHGLQMGSKYNSDDGSGLLGQAILSTSYNSTNNYTVSVGGVPMGGGFVVTQDVALSAIIKWIDSDNYIFAELYFAEVGNERVTTLRLGKIDGGARTIFVESDPIPHRWGRPAWVEGRISAANGLAARYYTRRPGPGRTPALEVTYTLGVGTGDVAQYGAAVTGRPGWRISAVGVPGGEYPYVRDIDDFEFHDEASAYTFVATNGGNFEASPVWKLQHRARIYNTGTGEQMFVIGTDDEIQIDTLKRRITHVSSGARAPQYLDPASSLLRLRPGNNNFEVRIGPGATGPPIKRLTYDSTYL